MKPISAVLLLVFLGVLAWLVYANVTVIRSAAAARQLQQGGAVASARVLDAGQSIHGQASTYRVRVTFTPPQGEAVTLEQAVDFATYSEASNARRAQVRYLPSDPRRAEIVGNAEGGVTAALVIVLDALFLGFAGFLGWALLRGK